MLYLNDAGDVDRWMAPRFCELTWTVVALALPTVEDGEGGCFATYELYWTVVAVALPPALTLPTVEGGEGCAADMRAVGAVPDKRLG